MTTTLNELIHSNDTVLLKGKECRVLPMDGFGMQQARLNQSNDETAPIVTYELAAKALGWTFDETFGTKDVLGITIREAAAVVEMSMRLALKVEAEASPFSAPAGETATV